MGRRVLPLFITLGLAACVSVTPPSTVIIPPTVGVQDTNTPLPAPSTPTPVDTLPAPSSAAWALVVSGLVQPVDLQHAGDSRLFVVEQHGVIRILNDGALHSEPFLDLRDRIGARGSEQGLLGLAFHPRFGENGWLFVNYTDRAGDTVIARYQAFGESVEPSSESVLLRIPQPFTNHNGGALAFGPDGYLYIATGDGGSAGDPQRNGQTLNTLLGKILRLDVDSEVPSATPPDNPFIGREDARPEIWAYGLRNPWRIAFDRLTGDLYIADVGQRDWEEINVQFAGASGGANYGWAVREGRHEFTGQAVPGMIEPVAEYGHNLGCSVTGGVVMRDPDLPDWDGTYLYGDFCSGRVWGLRRTADGSWLEGLLYEAGLPISSFGEGADGGVYLLDYAGSVYRLTPTG